MSDHHIDPAYKAALTYEEYFVPSMFKYWTPHLIDRAAPRPGEHALDVACGTGVVARSLVPIVGVNGKVSGLDKSSAMLSVACRNFSDYCDDIEWWEGVAENLPFPWQSFDLVLCQQGLQFFGDRPQAAREMKRVLRPGGRAAIAVWQSVDQNPVYQHVYSRIAEHMRVPEFALVAPFAYGDPQALEELLRDAGFNRIRVDTVTQDVFYATPQRFLELTFQAASAVMPIYGQLDAQTQTSTFEMVKQQLAPYIAEHTRDGFLTFPMKANIAVANY